MISMHTKVRAIPSLAVAAGLCLAQAGTASAAQVSYEELGTGITSTANPTGVITDYTMSGQVNDTFGNSFVCTSCSSSVLVTSDGNNFNFYDDYEFAVTASTFDAVSSTINLGQSLSISDLQVRLYSAAGNAPFLPVLGTPAGGVISGWSTPITFTAGSDSGEVSVLSNAMLDTGNYVLEVRGDVTGTAGGGYSGNLNVVPVPLPAGLPLMLSGMGMLGGSLRKRLAWPAYRRS
jgi:hypothetical protein